MPLDPSGVPSRADIQAAILDAFPEYEARNVVRATESNGRQKVGFGRTFSAPPVVTAVGGNGEHYWVPETTRTDFTFEATYPNGALIYGLVRILYIAIEAN
jgi:hypothetical protein